MKGTTKHRLMQEIGWEDPSYLAKLLPLQVSESTSHSLRMAPNYSLLESRFERFKRSFSPSTATL